jgi:hypothetical protein
VNIFDDMREALHDAAAYERGQAVNLRHKIPASAKTNLRTEKSAASAALTASDYQLDAFVLGGIRVE